MDDTLIGISATQIRNVGSGTGSRKDDHLRINVEHDVNARDLTTWLERFRFVHVALPEQSYDEIDLGTRFLGLAVRAPILISSMTGGTAHGWEINRRLARAAEELGCAMGVGSQRVAIEDPAASRWFTIRDVAPSIPVFANLGAVQLNYGFGVTECQRAVEMIGANALILHLNPLQEALQPEGNKNFSSLLRKIEAVCSSVGVPVIVKEVGFGISGRVARLLAQAGVAAIDVSGTGGTSWSAVEHQRAQTALGKRLSWTFFDWGIPTALSLQMVRTAVPQIPVIASGGLRSGIDAAKVIALGASLAGFAGPLVRAAAKSEEDVYETLEALIEELRLTAFCTGSRTLEDLQHAELFDDRGNIVNFPRSVKHVPMEPEAEADEGTSRTS